MKAARKRPVSARVLGQWVDTYARQHGQAPARVRNWVSHMVLGGALERAGFGAAGRKFTIKGGVALEMRLPTVARATKDLDLILLSDGDLIQELASALERPYEGFTFRLRGEPEVMPNRVVRVEVSLQFLGKSWGTVQVDVARPEGGGTEIDMVDAISLAPFGLDGPETLPCLSLPHHVAQKIHAMTAPPPEGRRNERFRDLLDLLLIRPLMTDAESVLKACREVFQVRGTHPWPPFLEVPPHWEEPFRRLAEDVGFDVRDVFHAAIDARQFISWIDSSAEWVASLDSLDDLTATTWYFVVGPDDVPHRIPVRVGEPFFTDGEWDLATIPTEWHRDPGGLVVVGVVLYLRERKPVFVEGVSTECVALDPDAAQKPVELGPSVWDALAREVLRQSRVPLRGADAFSIFLAKFDRTLPCVIANVGGVSAAQAHWWRVHWKWEWFVWDLYQGQPRKGRRRDATPSRN